jgi:Tol biopolymer transport system component
MTADRRFERDLPDLLAQLGHGPAPDYRDDIVQRTAAMRQRSAWTFPERWLPMDIATRRMAVAPPNWRLLALLGLLILGTIAVVLFAAGASQRLPAPPYGPAGNGLIAFSTNGDIYLGDPTGGTNEFLIGGPNMQGDTKFSPNGLRLGFIELRDEVPWLSIVDADGTDLRTLQPPCEACTGWLWSGDSATILTTSTDIGRDLILTDATTGEVIAAIDVPGEVHWARLRPPDDAQIAYLAGASGQGTSIHVVDRDGTGTHKEIAAADQIGGFEFSPDGTRIAYGKYVSAEDRWEVHVVNADGSNDHVVGGDPGVTGENGPIWSPDGQSLLVYRERGPALSLAILPADGGPGTDVDYSIPPSGFGWWQWSPDGKTIAFTDRDESEAVLIDVASGDVRPAEPWVRFSWQRLAP